MQELESVLFSMADEKYRDFQSRLMPTVPKEKIIGLSKTKDVAMPRQIMLYLIKEMTDLSLPAIGKFAKRDHTTVLYAINKISDQLSEDPNLEATLKDIRKNIRSAT
jgi:chromosomal replication initiator protein